MKCSSNQINYNKGAQSWKTFVDESLTIIIWFLSQSVSAVKCWGKYKKTCQEKATGKKAYNKKPSGKKKSP